MGANYLIDFKIKQRKPLVGVFPSYLISILRRNMGSGACQLNLYNINTLIMTLGGENIYKL